ncbi:hypothetical protein [Cupriavidus basilensis]|uniref:hypothetical protein n=1 Tax=Cupriavidus basilensis TaxID=68895 RepID=UPI00157B0ADC|nr:hypothetical protein [Cupriavidus basilensis]
MEPEALAEIGLRGLGVRIGIGDFRMGHFFSRPLASEDVSALLREPVPAPSLA